MELLFSLISPSPYVVWPHDWIGWLSLLAFLAVVAYINFRLRSFNKPLSGQRLLLFLALGVAALVTSLFLGFRLPAGRALPLPGFPSEPLGPAVMLFSALPWMLAAGLIGPLSASSLAFLSALLIALWDSHSPFAPLQMALLAALFAGAINQRYRTRFFSLLRRPLVAALLLAALYPFLLVLSMPFSATGPLVSRLDYTLTHLGMATLAMAIQLIAGGLFAEAIAAFRPNAWGRSSGLLPSPAEKSLQARFLSGMAPLALLLALGLMIGNWVVAGRAAREMLHDRMANAADIAAQNVPYFLQTGQNLITQLSEDPRLYQEDPQNLGPVLQQQLRQVPYFRQLFLLDSEGRLISSYPPAIYDDQSTSSEEQMGVQLALQGVPVQSYTIPPEAQARAAQVAFIASVRDASSAVRGVLIGHSDLISNPLTRPLLISLDNLAGVDGQGLLVDEDGRLVYHPDAQLLMSDFPVQLEGGKAFYDDTAPDGTRRLVYAQQAIGYPWVVVFSIPAQRAQALALEIATPLMAMIALLFVASLFVLRWGLQRVTGSLKTLSHEAGRISQGQLDHTLQVSGEDEVGQLRRSFESMRISLKARLDELNRLLLVSQGVASTLDFEEAVQPILEAAQSSGACSARIVLAPAAIPEMDEATPTQISYSAGPSAEAYAGVDEQILGFTRQQDHLVLTNPARLRLLNFPAGMPRPEALAAFALRHESLYFGTLWTVYDRPHTFSEEEIRFLATLAGQAALAAGNTRLFQTAEIGRQRLAAILSSNPDPVLVTDQHNNLILANPAAWHVLGLRMDLAEGKPVEELIAQKELVNLLQSAEVGQQSAEVCLPEGRVYLATASSVLAEGQRVGRVCVLRDVTYFKELDALKSEFVHTVSHDLRSPLTLMRGYATMLEMVGSLNENQMGYVRNIITSVEGMSRLVNNLLDLGRIEAGVGLQLELLSVPDIIERVVGALKMQAGQKHIDLEAGPFSPSLPLLEADQALLQQALHNLVENAVKYTRAEGTVSVQIQARQDRLVVEVRDTGLGISPMDQPHLFEKFYRGAQQGSKDQRGTGMGLAIVKSIAERHHGQVWVDSQLGKGSTFYLAIPLRQPGRPGAARA